MIGAPVQACDPVQKIKSFINHPASGTYVVGMRTLRPGSLYEVNYWQYTNLPGFNAQYCKQVFAVTSACQVTSPAAPDCSATDYSRY